MIRPLLAAAALALSAIAPAQAADPIDGLAWQWNGQTRQYHMQSTLLMPEWVWIRSLNNLEVRAIELYLDVLTTCAPEKEGKTKWFVKCKIDAVGIEAAAMPRDAGLAEGEGNALQQILNEWKERLEGKASMEISWTADGRLGYFKWVDLDRRNRRDLENLEIFRQLFMRGFSPLQMRLPKKGSDMGLGAIEEKNPMLVGYPAGVGGVGAVRAVTTLTRDEGSLLKISTRGDGSIGHPTATSPVMTQDVANTFAMTVEADGVWDTAGGHLVSREATIEGIASAGSAVSEGRQALPYIQLYKVQLVAPGDETPPVRETQPIKPKR
jgi:hypothetical protein